MKKTILTTVLLLCFVLSCFPTAFADSAAQQVYSCYADGSGSGLNLKNLGCTTDTHSSCGEVKTVTYGGRKAYLFDDSAKTGSLEFEFAGAFANGNTEFKNVEIAVEYADTNYGAFYIDYDSYNGNNKKISDYTELYNTSYGKTAPEVKTAVYRIEDAVFKNHGGYHGSDFKINVPKSDRGKGVYIYGVSVSVLDTVSGIDISSESQSAGNIFFDGDEKSVDVTFTSRRADSAALDVVFSVTNENGALLDTYTEKLNVAAGTAETVGVSLAAAHRYGIYTLSVEGTDAEKNIRIEKKIPFSVCVNGSASGGNDQMGMGAHFNWGREYEGAMSIIKKMGVNNIRDSYSWAETETEKGTYTEPQKFTSYLAAAKENGFGLVLMAGYGNSLYGLSGYSIPKTVTEREAFACYVKNMLDRHGEDVDAVEIWNEPDIDTFNQNSATPADYARLVKAVCDKIHGDYPNVQIAGPVMSQSLTTSGQAWLEQLLKCDTDGNGKYDMAEYLGTVSVHHYPQGHYLTVSQSVEKLKTLNGLLEKYGCGDKPRYHTEFGLVSLGNRYFSSYCKEDGILINRGDKKCAAQLSQYFLQLTVNNVADRYYIYEFSDNGLAENSGLLGITKSTSGETLNEAKPSLIALANINRLIAGFESVGETVSGSRHELRFENKNTGSELLTVYTEEENGSEEYELDADGRTAEFFDMYGNTFRPIANADGAYTLTITEEPIYVRLSGMNEASVSAIYDNGAVRLDGRVYGVSAGEPLAIRVLDSEGKTVYLNQITVGSDNAFSAVFDAAQGASYVLNLGNRKFDGIYVLDVDGADIKRCKVSVAANNVSIGAIDELRAAEGAVIRATLYDSGINDFRLVVGYYKGGTLIKVQLLEKDSPYLSRTDGENTYTADMKQLDDTSADCIKIFMFDGSQSITPLTENITLE